MRPVGVFVHHREVGVLLVIAGAVISLMPWYVQSSFGTLYFESMLAGLMTVSNLTIEIAAFLYFLGLALVLVSSYNESVLMVPGMAIVLVAIILGAVSFNDYAWGLGFILALLIQVAYWYGLYTTAKPKLWGD